MLDIPQLNIEKLKSASVIFNVQPIVTGENVSSHSFSTGHFDRRNSDKLPLPSVEERELIVRRQLGPAVVYEDQLYAIDRQGPVYLYSENAWLKVADIQSYAVRPIFPAPVVNRQILKC